MVADKTVIVQKVQNQVRNYT